MASVTCSGAMASWEARSAMVLAPSAPLKGHESRNVSSAPSFVDGDVVDGDVDGDVGTLITFSAEVWTVTSHKGVGGPRPL